jgi:hypothetical protein
VTDAETIRTIRLQLRPVVPRLLGLGIDSKGSHETLTRRARALRARREETRAFGVAIALAGSCQPRPPPQGARDREACARQPSADRASIAVTACSSAALPRGASCAASRARVCGRLPRVGPIQWGGVCVGTHTSFSAPMPANGTCTSTLRFLPPHARSYSLARLSRPLLPPTSSPSRAHHPALSPHASHHLAHSAPPRRPHNPARRHPPARSSSHHLLRRHLHLRARTLHTHPRPALGWGLRDAPKTCRTWRTLGSRSLHPLWCETLERSFSVPTRH